MADDFEDTPHLGDEIHFIETKLPAEWAEALEPTAESDSWILLNYLPPSTDAAPDDLGEYTMRSGEDIRHIIHIPVAAVIAASESDAAEWTSHALENSRKHIMKGVLILGLESEQTVEVLFDDNIERIATISEVDIDGDNITVQWSDGNEVSEVLQFGEDGQLPDGIANIVIIEADAETKAESSNVEEAAENRDAVFEEPTTDNSNYVGMGDEPDNITDSSPSVAVNESAEDETREEMANENATAGMTPETNKELDTNENSELDNSELKNNENPDDIITTDDGFVEIEIIQEVDAALRKYTPEEQEQDFIEDWIQKPLPGHSKRLITSRFALTDLFRMFRTLTIEKENDDKLTATAIAIAEPSTRPYPLYPLSETQTMIYTEGTEIPNVRGLEVRSNTAVDVEKFTQEMPPGKPFDAIMRDVFDLTQPWKMSESKDIQEVNKNIQFLRLADIKILENQRNINKKDDEDKKAKTERDNGNPLRVGAWKGTVEQDGTLRIRIFRGHEVPVSEQRAVVGFTRTQPESKDIIASIPADNLHTDGYLYIPQPVSRPWVLSGRSGVLLYDIIRSMPRSRNTDRDVLFSSGTTIPVLTTPDAVREMDILQPAIFRTELLEQMPTLDQYLTAVLGSDDKLLITGWHDLQNTLQYIGRTTQNLPADAHALIADEITRSVETYRTYTHTIRETREKIQADIEKIKVPEGLRSTLALLGYANPFDERIRDILPPEVFGNLPHWGYWSGRSADEWVQAGMSPVLEPYWIATMSENAVAADAALVTMRVVARRVRQQLETRNRLALSLGHPRAIHNPCPHVPFSDREEQAAAHLPNGHLVATRRLLDRFGGRRDNAWVYCFQCKHTLVCAHDLLLLDAQAHPEDEGVLMKQLVLRFSSNALEGSRFMCGNCGKQWQGVTYDADPLSSGGRGENEDGEDMFIEDPDDDWAAAAGYDGAYIEEGDADAVDEAAADDEQEAAVAATPADGTEDVIIAGVENAEEMLHKSRSPLMAYPYANRIIRDIVNLIGVNLTFDAEEKLATMHLNFPRRPPLGRLNKIQAEMAVIRYIARYAAVLLVLARLHPSLIPVRVGAVTGVEEEDTGLSERLIATKLSKSQLRHEPWRRLAGLASGETKAIKDRGDEFFKQINRAINSLTAELAQCEGDDCELVKSVGYTAIAGKFRVPATFRPRLQWVAVSDDPTETKAALEAADNIQKPDLSATPGSSVSTYYQAVDTLLQALAREARKAPPTPEQFGAHSLPGLSVEQATNYINNLATIRDVPDYIRAAGAIFEHDFSQKWKRTIWHVPLKQFPLEIMTAAPLTIDDWRVLFARVCASGENEGRKHRFLRRGKCVYCGIPIPTDSEPAVVPSIEAGQALLDSIRQHNIIATGDKRVKQTDWASIRTLMLSTIGIRAEDASRDPILRVAYYAYGPVPKDIAASEKTLGSILNDLNNMVQKSNYIAATIPGIAALCDNPFAACRDLLQYIALPIARWAEAGSDVMKGLERIGNNYDLYNDHRRDVEQRLGTHIRRLPAITKRTDDLIRAATQTAQRISSLYRLREVWTVGFGDRLDERGILGDRRKAYIDNSMFTVAVYAAMQPWLKASGRDGLAFTVAAVTRWSEWTRLVQLSTVNDILLRHSEAEKDLLLREYESRDEDDKRLLGVQKRLHIGRYEAGDVRRMDRDVYKRDRDLAAKLDEKIKTAVAR